MNRKVLVLNYDFSPLTICSVQRAFVLVYLRKAELLSAVKDSALRSVNEVFQMPAVIRIGRYVSVPYKGVMLTRQNVFRRDSYACQYCGSAKDLTIDHVIPRSKNGKSTWSNLVTACKRCNSRKGDRSPEQVGFRLKTKPVKPSYLMYLKDQAGSIYDEWQPFLKTG